MKNIRRKGIVDTYQPGFEKEDQKKYTQHQRKNIDRIDM